MPLPLLAIVNAVSSAVGSIMGGKSSGMTNDVGVSAGIQVAIPRMHHGLVGHYNTAEMDGLMHDIQNDVIYNARKYLDAQDIDFTTDLSKSIVPEKVGDQFAVIVKSPYGGLVEFGTPAGTTVNFNALRIWVVGKLQVPVEEADVVTIKIMNKIKSKGIKPTRFFKKAIKAVISEKGVLRSTSSGKKKGKKASKPTKNKEGKMAKLYKKIKKIYKNRTKTIKKITKSIDKFNKVASTGNKY